MSIYSILDRVELVREKPFLLEKDLQKLVESNIDLLLNYRLIRSEFSLEKFRIDTLAFDPESRSFIFIEYKRDKNFSVIDQGDAYLALMLNNKADFVLEYNETQESILKRSDVDWSQSKVLFVAPTFTTYQREAINFRDLPIELWEIKKFENETFSFEQIQKTAAKESIKTVSGTNAAVATVSNEIKIYTEEDHLHRFNSENTIIVYNDLKSRILNFDDNIKIQPKKFWISFVTTTNIFCDFILQSSGVKIVLNLKIGELDDPKILARDISNVGHYGNGCYEIKVSSLEEDIDYIMSLIKQSFKKHIQKN